jgi:hypothetical protein
MAFKRWLKSRQISKKLFKILSKISKKSMTPLKLFTKWKNLALKKKKKVILLSNNQNLNPKATPSGILSETRLSFVNNSQICGITAPNKATP